MLIRPFDASVDSPLILSSWIRTIRRAGPARHMSPSVFARHVEHVVKPLITRAETLIACDDTHRRQIFGYVVGEGTTRTLHAIYVRSSFRRFGTATALMTRLFGAEIIGEKTIMYTHPTRMTGLMRDRWCLVFNPYLIGGESL